ncbi:hypothetical protein [Paenibacillus brasilensis]|uniref:Uncharacterized protein n=1 Tax=Paenibacillus brasilensis TaxID=128574 RepID=A0ABU0L567_9BACL|nr:hypothetical protein [Paenibacillus brasilensis]MDQ0496410.1 hypothetical protein [Paenibacillus brasilensis]
MVEEIFILKSIYYQAIEHEIRWTYWLFIATALTAGYFSWEMILNLPKPETFLELGKYYFTDTAAYLRATALSLITGLMLLVGCFIGLVSAISNEAEYSNLYRVFIIIVGLLTGLASLYFLYYGVYLLFVLAIIALIAVVALNSGTSNGRRK